MNENPYPCVLHAHLCLPDAAVFTRWFAVHLQEEEVQAHWIAPEGSVRFLLDQVGSLSLQLEGASAIRAELRAADARMAQLMRLSLGEHLQEFADEAGLAAAQWRVDWREEPTGVQSAPAHSPGLHILRVASNTAISPRMRRIRLQAQHPADAPAVFAQGGLHVRMLLPHPGTNPSWPTVDADGRLHWPKGAAPLPRRTYTIRALDAAARSMDIDVLVHGEHGGAELSPGAQWARSARTGDPVAVLSPAGGRLPQAQRLVLVADACALPAAARIVESTQGQVHALCWVESQAERAALEGYGLGPHSVDWLCAEHPGQSPQGIAQVLAWLARQDWTQPQGLELWAAGGHAMGNAIRQWVRGNPALAPVRRTIASYWR
ncbi:siderophore-interacting protein [Comamonas humi]